MGVSAYSALSAYSAITHKETMQKLTPYDKKRKEAVAVVLIDKIEENMSFLFLPYLFTSDEAHFHLDGQVNSTSNFYWGTERPNEVAQKPLHSAKVTAWCELFTMGWRVNSGLHFIHMNFKNQLVKARTCKK